MRPTCMGRLLALALLTLTALVGAPAPAFACSCAALTPEEYAESADLVVAGTITDVDMPSGLPVVGGDEADYEVAADVVYKGRVTERFAFSSEASGAACGMEGLEEGERMLLFLTRSGDRLWGGLCGGTDFVTEDQVRAVLQPVAGQPTPGAPSADPPVMVLAGVALVTGGVALVGVARLRRRP